MAVVFVIAAVAFVLYVIAEKQTDRANELRYQSFVLADELRQSSDDLTRMVRTYVLTGDPIYKQYFQEILDIRDGKKPRPVKYTYVYWDLILSGNRRPCPDGPAVALLELMRQAGFTEPELTVMEQAKGNSDALTVREFAAMALIESTNPITDANRLKASQMLNDADYRQAKAGILRPINEFYRMIDERTQGSVLGAERKATLLSIIVTLFGVLLVFTLWNTYRTLQAILGCKADDLQRYITRLGSGDFSSPPPALRHVDSSVLAWLSETQSNLARIDAERKQAEAELLRTHSLLSTISESSTDVIYIKDVQGRYLLFNKEAHRATGKKQEEVIGCDDRFLFPAGEAKMVMDGDRKVMESKQVVTYEEVVTTIRGATTYLSTKGPVFDGKGNVIGLFGIARDITDRKKAEDALRIAATAFESQEGMAITDANGTILRVNQAFCKVTGYSAEEVVGKNPRLLKSGRHDADFYAAMWGTIYRTGSWEGEIWNRRKNGEVYPEHLTITAVKNANEIVTNYVSTLTDITLTKAAEDEIKHLAFYDPLTRLPNRRLLMDRLRQALASVARNRRTGALLFIDLDNFKTLNDTLGHDVGDLLLQQVARRLESCVREGDTVARLGGDEFVVMLEDLSEHTLEAAKRAESVGNKILSSLNQPYRLAAHEHHSTASIGATLFNNNTMAIDELLKQADIAMYQSKKAERNNLRFFDPHMQEAINTRASLESELHRALENGQFQLYYQLQVDCISENGVRHPLGAEVLIRWLHPERGVVLPAEFIPLAEESGLIHSIGQWVLDTACARIKAWQGYPKTQNLVLAVNVSARQFRQKDFVSQVKTIVQRHAINPGLLKLELTESLLLEDIEDVIVTMNALSEIGIQFSLDDFGTGYSSLQYLKRLPLRQIKIAQSFVRNLDSDSDDKAIVNTVIAMANSLEMNVIAEGVETEAQLTSLLQMGCTHHQGYLFGKPMPIEQFAACLR